mmetsp:Transcript_8789/g.29016  ORF Transcript_8789/g.29016 Transcript_8789/m.29016 type:complete len:210 (-) Transcript_8789:456-1085(-)
MLPYSRCPRKLGFTARGYKSVCGRAVSLCRLDMLRPAQPATALRALTPVPAMAAVPDDDIVGLELRDLRLVLLCPLLHRSARVLDDRGLEGPQNVGHLVEAVAVPEVVKVPRGPVAVHLVGFARLLPESLAAARVLGAGGPGQHGHPVPARKPPVEVVAADERHDPPHPVHGQRVAPPVRRGTMPNRCVSRDLDAPCPDLVHTGIPRRR